MTGPATPPPPPIPPGASAPRVRVRPSGWWYVLVPILWFAGLGFGILSVVERGIDAADSFREIRPGGSATVVLDAGDSANVYAVWQDGRDSESLTRPAATVTVQGPDGADVAFRSPNGRTTFDFGDESGIELGSFEADAGGAYEVRADFPDADPSQPAYAAVGELDLSSIAAGVLRPIGLGTLAATALWILLLVLRGRSKRRARATASVTPVVGRPDPRGPFV